MSALAEPGATLPDPTGGNGLWTERYAQALMNTFGTPKRVLVRGDGCYVWDADGRRYLDLLAGIAVNALGHAHPTVLGAVSSQLATLGHVSNFFASPPQVVLAERILALLGATGRGRVFFTNSGTEAVEAAVKLSRRTGRTRLVAAEGSFHGRTMGALSLTSKPAYREPFQPLLDTVTFVPFGDVAALQAAVDETVAAVVLEPIQGEGGVLPAPPGYLTAARAVTREHGALLVLDEVQTGIGRTGDWFAHTAAAVEPDVVLLAKALGAGLPIGACVGVGEAAALLTPGQHGTTFGGNPVACAAGLAVLHTIERDDLLAQVRRVGERLRVTIEGLGHRSIAGVRGAGLLLGVALREPIAGKAAAAALEAGFIVNDVAPDTLRLAPPLILTAEQADEFCAALPAILDVAAATA